MATPKSGLERLLYYVTPLDHVSLFDVTLFADTGFDQIIPLTKI